MEECTPTVVVTEQGPMSVTSTTEIDVLTLADKIRSTLDSENPDQREISNSLQALELLTLQVNQSIADKDAAIAAVATTEGELKRQEDKYKTLSVMMDQRKSTITEYEATIGSLQRNLSTTNKSVTIARAELRTARDQLVTTRKDLATATENSLQVMYGPEDASTGCPTPQERSKGKDVIRQIITQLKAKADGANKGTKLMSKMLHYIVCTYQRVEDVPTSTMRAYTENLKRFPTSHLRAKNAAIDIKAGIKAVQTAVTPSHRFSSLLIDQLRRSQKEIESLNKRLEDVTRMKEKEEATSNRIRGNRDKADSKVRLLERKVDSLSKSLDTVTSSGRDLQAEIRRVTQSNSSLTGLVKKLHDQGNQSANDTRPSQNDLRYLQSAPVICAYSDIVHWKWTTFLDGYQETYYEFLSPSAARTIIQRSDQSTSTLPTGQKVIRLTRNGQPLDVLTSSYGTSQLKAPKGLQALFDEAYGDATMPIIDLGPRPDKNGAPSSITGVMTGVTIREFNDRFRKDNRTPFVQVFGSCKTYKYVLTASYFIPLKKPVGLKDLQKGYSHKPRAGSYVPSLGLTDQAYSSLQGTFMEWTSVTTKSTGPPHPLLTGPVDAVAVSVQKVVNNRRKQIEAQSKKRKKRAEDSDVELDIMD